VTGADEEVTRLARRVVELEAALAQSQEDEDSAETSAKHFSRDNDRIVEMVRAALERWNTAANTEGGGSYEELYDILLDLHEAFLPYNPDYQG
jgi:hypothetical protein